MKWSYRVLRVAGIDIRVHVTLLLTLLLGAAAFSRGGGVEGAIFGVVLLCCLFLCVTLHELGHSLVAQRFGATVREIILLPIGGIAKLTSEPTRPLEELLVAIAGPLVNVAIAVGLFFALGLGPADFADEAQLTALLNPPGTRALLASLMFGNAALAIFNMIPAFPMDGGRVFRALLSFVVGRLRATAIATVVGQLLACGLVVVALLEPNPLLALVGMFVFFAASQEKLQNRAGEVLDELTAGDVCDPSARSLSPADDLGDIVDHALRSPQTLFPVVLGSDLVGVVLREEALRAASRVGLRASVMEVTRRDLPAVDAKTPLVELRARLADSGAPLVVTEDRQFVGVLSAEDLARITVLAARLAAAGIRRPKLAPLAPQPGFRADDG